MARLALVQREVQVFELRRQEVPVVQQLLHARGDAGGEVGAVQVARDDDQLAVARTVLVGGEFHRGFRLVALLSDAFPAPLRRVSPPGPCWRWRWPCCCCMACCCRAAATHRPCWRRWRRAARWCALRLIVPIGARSPCLRRAARAWRPHPCAAKPAPSARARCRQPLQPAPPQPRGGHAGARRRSRRTVPVYATRLPAAASLHYRLQRGAAVGAARLQWQREAGDYLLRLDTDLAGPAGGGLGQPRAHRHRRRGAGAPRRTAPRARSARRQLPARGRRITFSGPQLAYPLPPGAQDRLSWMIQLPASSRPMPRWRAPAPA